MGRFLLLAVASLMIMFSIIQVGVQRRMTTAAERNINYFEQSQSRNIANSLAERALREIKENVSWRNGISASNYLEGSGQVIVDDATTDPSLGQFDLQITSTGTFDDVMSTVKVVMRRTSFSKYSYFTNVEPAIYFITNDTIHGPTHTNGNFHISGRPVFTGKVSSPNYWRGNGDPEFLGGADFGSDQVTLPKDLNGLRNAASNGGLIVNDPSKVVFKDDGTVEVARWLSTGWYGGYWDSPQVYNLSDLNGVISSDENLYVEGIVDGQVTVHSEKNIFIDGDVTYAVDPRDDKTSDDLCGIISEKRVIVSKDAHSSNGTQDLSIHASIMALGRSFTVENFAAGSPRGSLKILGGVIQETRGAVGSFYSGGSRPILKSGYQKLYTYDERLLSQWPPFFPVHEKYSLISWRE